MIGASSADEETRERVVKVGGESRAQDKEEWEKQDIKADSIKRYSKINFL